MKKIIALGLVLLLILSLLCACADQPDVIPDDTTTPEEDTTSDITPAENNDTDGFALLKNDVAPVFRYPILAEGADFTTAKTCAEKLARYLKTTITREDDSKRDPDAVEILFGDTSYSESAALKTELSYSDGIVRVIGNKLVFVASDSTELGYVFDQFYFSLAQFKQDNGDYLVPKEYSMTASSTEVMKGLPVLSGKTPTIYDEGDDSRLLLFSKCNESDYTTYRNTFVNANYRVTATNNLEGNLFTTLTNGEKIVNLAWTPKTKDLRVMVDPASSISLPNSEAENVYDKTQNVTTTITQVGLWQGAEELGSGTDYGVSCEGRYYATAYAAGMSYVIRLSDGSFILIDGGYGTDDHATNLYEVLKKQAPDPENIVIAAWIFTHAHDDHVGIVSKFISKYANKVKIEKFIFNFPEANRGKNDGGGGALETQVRNALKNNKLKDAKIIKAHAGQVDYIRNAKVEILLTLEMMEQTITPYKLSYYNDCSVIFKIEVNGKKLLFTGDAGPSGDNHEESYLKKFYTAQTLQADILQLNHHAITDGSHNYTFEYANPTWAFVPAASWQVKVDGKYCNDKARSYNSGVVALENTGHAFLAGKGVQTLTVATNGTITAQTWDTVSEYLEA